MRRVDIAHSGQTVCEAIEQLEAEVKNARRARETALLVVHGFGASGVGGAIKAAVAAELPRLARNYGFKAYGYTDKDRIPQQVEVDPRRLNPGSTLLIFRPAQPDKESHQDFRPNFRTLRSKVRVRVRSIGSTQDGERCRHEKRQRCRVDRAAGATRADFAARHSWCRANRKCSS